MNLFYWFEYENKQTTRASQMCEEQFVNKFSMQTNKQHSYETNAAIVRKLKFYDTIYMYIYHNYLNK